MKIERRFFLVPSMLICMAWALTLVNAQQQDVPVTKKRDDRTLIDRTQRQRENQVTDQNKINTEPPIEPNSIRVRIRYQRDFGYLTSSQPGNQEPYSCNAFVVDGRVWTGEPGTFGRPKTGSELDALITVVSPSLMRVDHGYYVCDFTVEQVPLNESINVRAAMSDNVRVLTGRWREGSQPQPPPGSERLILNGQKNVKLTKGEPSVTVDFEMIYRPVQLPRE